VVLGWETHATVAGGRGEGGGEGREREGERENRSSVLRQILIHYSAK